jgi:DNA-binding CsgD family transcriptional regulator
VGPRERCAYLSAGLQDPRILGAWLRPTPDHSSCRFRHAESMLQECLTKREHDTAVLLAYGHTNREVARQLAVSVRTVEGERARLMRKLGFDRRSELVRWALEQRLLH